ncbi:hypothetical protein [Brachyspira pilosicoli]|uniref:hypothetical protein n=1 Tax=Brachyspira pilosicoli TaxID=52584 RepID=UPI001CA53D5C|nr:hypothetical protein [Brachyspira pilosicoli]MBW5397254.1 hypothetical protein [Brachyspira pilosicoli]
MSDNNLILDETEVLAVRFIAEYPDLDQYIYFVFFIDKLTINLITKTVLISDSYELFEVLNSYDNYLELYKYIEVYNNVHYKVNIILDKLNSDLDSILANRTNVVHTTMAAINNDIISIIDIFSDTLNISMDYNIGIYDVNCKGFYIDEVNNFIQEFKKEFEGTSIDISQYILDSNNDKAKENTEDSIIAKYKIVNGDFVVAPIMGRAIADIKLGDKIIVKVDYSSFYPNMTYLDINTKKNNNNKYFVVGEVIDKTVNEHSTKIALALSDEHCVIIEETEPIKVKVFNPQKDSYVTPNSYQENSKEEQIYKMLSHFNVFKFLLYGLGFISLFVLVYILYVIIL